MGHICRTGDAEPEKENCQFISESSLEHLKMQENQSEGVHSYGMDAYEFFWCKNNYIKSSSPKYRNCN